MGLRRQLQGSKALERTLRKLDKKIAKKIGRAAITKTATPVAKAMKRAAPKGETGNLRKAVTKRIKTYSGGAVAVIGTAYKRAPHDHLVEDGTAERKTDSGASRGEMPAEPFVDPTFESMKHQSQKKLETELWNGIKAAVQ